MKTKFLAVIGLVFCAYSFASQPPKWTADPINGGQAGVNTAYTFDLGNFIETGPGISAVSCSKVSGPAWLVVDGICEVAGTPASADLGANSFKVRVTNDKNESADATFNITVK